MSRSLIITWAILIASNTYAQFKEFTFNVGVSNNGQVNHIDRFVYDGFSPSGSHKYSEEKIKFDFWSEVQLKDDWYLTLKTGFGHRTDSYRWNDQGSKGQANQNFKEFALGFNYKVSVKRVDLSTGISFPYFKVSDYDRQDTYVGSNAYGFIYHIKGGNAFGISSISSIRLRIISNLYVYTNVSIGYLKTKIGGHVKSSTDYTDPQTVDEFIEFDGLFYGTSQITNPEFSIGVGYKLKFASEKK